MRYSWPALGLALGLAASPAAGADVYIGLDAARSGKSQWVLAFPPFSPEDARRKEDVELARTARELLRSDLLFSRYFDLVDQGTPGASFLLTVRCSQVQSQITLTVKLRDIASGEISLERYYRQNPAFWRSAVHRVADDVVRQLTGRPGIAHSQLAFINDHSGSKEVWLADYDGEDARRLTSNRSINLLPRWHPSRKALAFTSYKDGNPDLFLYDLERGEIKTLSDRQGLNLSGGFSPDGKRLAATLSRQKNPNIYILNLENGSDSKVTDHFGADASPTFSPDGESLAFVSDRSGNPQVHILELSTGRARRLTRLNWCDAPAWSPTGEWVAFAGRANPKDKMDIFLVDITGTKLIQLTHGEGSNEDPAWSPDGRFLAFTTDRGPRRQLYVMDADGSAPHAVADLPGNSFTPSWSP